MLFATIAPLLPHLSLKFEIQSAGDDRIAFTIIPRRREGATGVDDASELRPISLTGTIAELDAELAKGEAGALGKLIAARKTLSEQIAEQIATDKAAADEKQKAAASKAAKAKSTPAAPIVKTPTEQTPAVPAGDPTKPVTLW